MNHALRSAVHGLAVCVATLCLSARAQAGEAAHVHGLMHIDIAVDKQLLLVQLESPLDGLLGFERRPRTPAERQAADALLERMGDAATLFKPDAAALCVLKKASIESAVLQSTTRAAGKDADRKSEHADLDASYEFSCTHPDKLTTMELGLFDAFKRLQKIEVQVAGARSQSRQTLQRPDKLVKLTR
ncbi:MAG: DUF2796 domain-containing protein [Burkholderiales bacterium]